MRLQAGAAAGLSLSEIGSVLSRPLVGMDEEPSELEKLCSAAHAQVMQAAISEELGARWSSLDSDDDWLIDGAQDDGNSDADTSTPHMLMDLQVLLACLAVLLMHCPHSKADVQLLLCLQPLPLRASGQSPHATFGGSMLVLVMMDAGLSSICMWPCLQLWPCSAGLMSTQSPSRQTGWCLLSPHWGC